MGPMVLGTTSDGLRRAVVVDGGRLSGSREWRELADVIILTCAAQRPAGLLLDVRTSPFTPTAREADVLASALCGCPICALVTRPDVSYGCARMVATSVEMRGRAAGAFQDEAQAWAWIDRRLAEREAGQETH